MVIQEVVQHFQLRLLPESQFFMLVWVKSFQTLSSFIQTVWHQEYLVWEMSLPLLRRLKHSLTLIRQKLWKKSLRKQNLILMTFLSIWDRLRIWVVSVQLWAWCQDCQVRWRMFQSMMMKQRRIWEEPNLSYIQWLRQKEVIRTYLILQERTELQEVQVLILLMLTDL